MAETLRTRYGRTVHAIHLLASGSAAPLMSGCTPFPQGSEEEAGYLAARITQYKDIVRKIFRTSTTMHNYSVGNNPFTVFANGQSFTVPGGIVTQVGFQTFPLNTTLMIANGMLGTYQNVGNPEIIS